MLLIPPRFNKNAADVQAMGTPAETGKRLIDYMCRRIGVADLGNQDVLDFGCGSRFTDAIINRDLPVRTYTGIDLDQEMIDWLSGNVSDPRLAFFSIAIRNPMYKPDGQPFTSDYVLPIGGRTYDLICMFSVITHQLPDDAAAIFKILRRHVRASGKLFFSAGLEPGNFGYRELQPDQPTGFSAYSLDLLTDILASAGWQIESVEGSPEASRGIPILPSLLCRPA